MVVTIVGVDCATDARRVGLALGTWNGHRTVLEKALPGASVGSVAGTIGDWLAPSGRALLAMDAPLGWPEPLGRELHAHQAGGSLGTPPNLMFRRLTDRAVKSEIGKQPLDVGADRIARTAHAALSLLDDLRRRTGEPIPLAWQPQFSDRVAAIEVYPAGTLAACQVAGRGYKPPEHMDRRAVLVNWLAGEITLPDDPSPFLESADVLDAALCVLAGADFLCGAALAPDQQEMATVRREGWIWVRRPQETELP